MRFFQKIFILPIVLLLSCVENNIPYPYVEGLIKEIAVEGQVGEAEIDPVKRTVRLQVSTYVELESIEILKLVITEDASIIPSEEGPHRVESFPTFGFNSVADLPSNANTKVDFNKPFELTIKTYQEYDWKIIVEQKIDRVVTVENQTGEAIINNFNKTVVVYVPPSQNLRKIKFLSFNLEGENSVTEPDPLEGTHDFSRPIKFSTYRNEKLVAVWSIDVIPSEMVASIGSSEPWATKAHITGGVKTGGKPVVEYKKSSDSNWATLDDSALQMQTETTFKGTISGLDDGSNYQWRINVDGQYSDVGTFTTEKIEVIPNLNFDIWSQSGKNWYANADAADSYWASGNSGVTSGLAGSKDPITVGVSGDEAYKGMAAKLTSITGVLLVRSAAGNLFIGNYKTNASNPSSSVSFGRPFSGARPTKLEGYFKYYPKPINEGTYPENVKMDNDHGHIYIKLWDAADNLFAEGEYVITKTVDTYTKFSIDINYKNLKARPAKITIVATSSRYGGDFEGAKVVGKVGDGSTLYVDEFELIYD